MKKAILAAAALATLATASAFGLKDPGTRLAPAHNPVINTEEIPARFISNAPRHHAPASRAEEEEVLYTLAGDPYQAFGYQGQTPGIQIGMAMQLEPTFVNEMNGNELTKIVFYTGLEQGAQENKLKRATVFVTNDLTADPVYTQEPTCPAAPAAEAVGTLDTPYVIETGKKTYVGVYYTINSANNLPVVVDYTAHDNTYGGWVGIRTSPNNPWTWDNITSQFGFVCVGAYVKGSNFPKNSVAITDIDGQPVAYQDTPFEVDFMFHNNGSNDVNSVKVEFSVNGGEAKSSTVTMPQAVGFNKSAVIRMTDITAATPAKEGAVSVKVTEVNGEPNTSADNAATFPVTVIPAGMGFDRNVVVEEFTSTSCAYCPVGYTGMEYVHDNYPDGDLIPVAVHVNYPGSDPLTAPSFNSVYKKYGEASGVPSAVMNRAYDVYPIPENLAAMFSQLRTLPALASVKAEASFDPATRMLSIDAATSFSFDYTDGDKNFALSFAVTEDNVGPLAQQNGYAGQDGDYLGWQDQPSPVQLVYNDVARQLDTYAGIKESVPAAITAGQEYPFHHEVKVLQSVSDVNRINLVAYLVNKKTGEIENSVILRSGSITGLAGIENVAADTPADSTIPAEYYNLQGIRVAAPAAGIYIRRQGSSTAKVLLP